MTWSFDKQDVYFNDVFLHKGQFINYIFNLYFIRNMIAILKLSLLFLIGIVVDFLFAFSLVETPPDMERTENNSSKPREERHNEGLSDGLPFKLQSAIGISIVLVFLLCFGVAFCAKEWYLSSYTYTIARMRRRCRFLPRKTDPRVKYGPDGRPNWIDCYGPYEAQDAVDMINTLALTQHHSYFYNGPQNFPMYGIKGRELSSIDHAFEDLPVNERPSFKYLHQGEPSDGISWHTHEDDQDTTPDAADTVTNDNGDYKAETNNCDEEKQNCNTPEKETSETEKVLDLKPTSHGDAAVEVAEKSVVKKFPIC